MGNTHFLLGSSSFTELSIKFPHFPICPPESPIDYFLRLDPHIKHCISTIYELIQTPNPGVPAQVKIAWVEDLGSELSKEKWENILEFVHSSSVCTRHGLLQWKSLHRIYYTSAKLAKIYSNVSDACNWCKHSLANLMQMFWSYLKWFDYWTKIFKTLQDAFNVTLCNCRCKSHWLLQLY